MAKSKSEARRKKALEEEVLPTPEPMESEPAATEPELEAPAAPEPVEATEPTPEPEPVEQEEKPSATEWAVLSADGKQERIYSLEQHGPAAPEYAAQRAAKIYGSVKAV